MKMREIFESTTTSGSVATIAMPIGGVIKRIPDSFFAGVPVNDADPYPNTPDYMKKKKKKNVK